MVQDNHKGTKTIFVRRDVSYKSFSGTYIARVASSARRGPLRRTLRIMPPLARRRNNRGEAAQGTNRPTGIAIKLVACGDFTLISTSCLPLAFASERVLQKPPAVWRGCL